MLFEVPPRGFDCLLWELVLTLVPICWQMGTKSLYYRGSVLPTLKMTSYVEMSISSDHWRGAIYCVKPPIRGLIWTNFCQTQYFYDILWGAQMRIQWRRVREVHLLKMKRVCHIRLSVTTLQLNFCILWLVLWEVQRHHFLNCPLFWRVIQYFQLGHLGSYNTIAYSFQCT